MLMINILKIRVNYQTSIDMARWRRAYQGEEGGLNIEWMVFASAG
jgi:hypothetical protein